MHKQQTCTYKTCCVTWCRIWWEKGRQQHLQLLRAVTSTCLSCATHVHNRSLILSTLKRPWSLPGRLHYVCHTYSTLRPMHQLTSTARYWRKLSFHIVFVPVAVKATRCIGKDRYLTCWISKRKSMRTKTISLTHWQHIPMELHVVDKLVGWVLVVIDKQLYFLFRHHVPRSRKCSPKLQSRQHIKPILTQLSVITES